MPAEQALLLSPLPPSLEVAEMDPSLENASWLRSQLAPGQAVDAGRHAESTIAADGAETEACADGTAAADAAAAAADASAAGASGADAVDQAQELLRSHRTPEPEANSEELELQAMTPARLPSKQ